MKSKILSGKFFSTNASKIAIITIIGVVGGAAASAGITHVVYEKKINEYKNELSELESIVKSYSNQVSEEKSLNLLEGETIRVYDSMVQVWDGKSWNNYASVKDIESKDPFNGSAEKRAAVELEVLNEKLAEAGLKIDESGNIVFDEEALAIAEENSDGNASHGKDVFQVGSIVVDKTAISNSNNATVVQNPVVPMAVPGIVPDTSAIVSGATAPASTWVSDNSSGGGSSSGSSSSGSTSSNNSPVADNPVPAPVTDTPSTPPADNPPPADTGGSTDSGSGGGDTGGEEVWEGNFE